MLHGLRLALVCLMVGTQSLYAAEPLAPMVAAERPNVVVILADDLGYGDVQCYNPDRGKILTPHIDSLARGGMRFTDAHTSSGVCSPTRYALLTGRYHWRTRLQAGIVQYLERPLIAPNRLTLAGLFHQHGYRTAMVGKWHLGWDWPITPAERPLFAPPRGNVGPVTPEHHLAWQKIYSQPIGGGPLACGFDEYFGTDVPNWPPYAFFENDRVTGLPGEFLPADQLTRTLASIPGPALKDWQLDAVLPALEARAVRIITTAAQRSEPFFLYLPLTSPHTPIVPTPAWQGKSGLNSYADFVMQTDAVVGSVLQTLQSQGVAEKTIVVFTSDNGCSPLADIPALQQRGHFPSGPLRGHKADAWEGGHRVPFVVRWPGIVPTGAVCNQLVHQADLIATFAEILGKPLPLDAGEDSFSLLKLWRGDQQPVRTYAVSHSAGGVPVLRKGVWKIHFGPKGSHTGNAPANVTTPGQLYNLAEDLGETRNVWSENPALVEELTAIMETLVNNGRSTPGPNQTNDVPVNWKRFLNPAKK